MSVVTNDDETADPDNPTADGAGSRHNYTVIGQVTLDYDKRRNVIADATREFRYNYRNQLRRVIRKSDDADISKYREDAYGRRVQAVIEWELGRRVYFDTRFELDVIMDKDADATDMKYVDGGLTSDAAPGPGLADQIAAWPSRLDEPISNARHYVDFHVDVPDVSSDSGNYLGFVAYDTYEVRIYGNRYELWTTGGGSAIATYTAPGNDTKGRHNIGIGAPGNVWIDGTSAMTGAAITASPEIRFGTQDSTSGSNVDGLVLLECLTYQKPLLRTADNEPLGATGARVTHHFFDGPQVVTTEEVYDPTTPDTGTSISSHPYVEAVSPTIQDTIDENDNRSPRMMLPNGRRATAVVIEQAVDPYVNDEGEVGDPGTGDNYPGVAGIFLTDAVGGQRYFEGTGYYGIPSPDSYATGSDLPEGGCYLCDGVSTRYGKSEKTVSTRPTSDPVPPPEVAQIDVEQGEQANTELGGPCACRADDPTTPNSSVAVFDIGTGMVHDGINGNLFDPHNGLKLCGDVVDLKESDIKAFPIKGQTAADEDVIKLRWDPVSRKYYRYVGRKTINGEERDVWGGPGCVTTDDGETIVGSDYAVPDNVIEALKLLAPSGVEVPESVYKVIGFLAKTFLFAEELALIIKMASDGKIDEQETNMLLGMVVTEGAIYLGIGACTAGLGYLAIKAIKAARKARLMKKLIDKLKKKRRDNGIEIDEQDFNDMYNHFGKKNSIKSNIAYKQNRIRDRLFRTRQQLQHVRAMAHAKIVELQAAGKDTTEALKALRRIENEIEYNKIDIERAQRILRELRD